MRWVIDELADILRSEGALREDLVVIPEECDNEYQLAHAVGAARVDWGLSQVPVPQLGWQGSEAEAEEETEAEEDQLPGPPEPEDESADSYGLFDPQSPTPAQLALCLTTLQFAASDVIGEAIRQSVETMLSSSTRTMFALVRTFWGFWGEWNPPYLWNGGVVRRDEPNVLATGATPAVLHVPIDETKLSALARPRYVHRGPYQPLEVFARIEGIDHRWPVVVLTPIVILSA